MSNWANTFMTISVSYSTGLELILTTGGVITSLRHLCCVFNVLKCEILRTQLAFFFHVETGAEHYLNINMSTEIWLVGVTKNSAHAYEYLYFEECGCVWAFSALSIYFPLHLFPSVTLSLCKYSLRLFVTLSSALLPSPSAPWTLLHVWYMLMKLTLSQESFDSQFGIPLKYFFNPPSLTITVEVKLGYAAILLSSLFLWVWGVWAHAVPQCVV